MKYVIVTGGVVSGLGKGVTISSMGKLLQSAGWSVTAIKIDPYLNVDAGTMSPFEHGEVFVLGDGGESDLDLGNYERFLGVSLTANHNLTTGKIYRKVILAERKGDYLGKTVQVVPHITDCIQDWIQEVAEKPVTDDDDDGETSRNAPELCLIEVGGTVGDIESSVFLEALRQFQFRVGLENMCLCFVSLVPTLSHEQKTKPTQHGVRDLRSLGLSPSVIFCRSSQPLLEATKQKISLFCHVPADNVLSVHDVNNVYHVPSLLHSQGLYEIIQKQLKLDPIRKPDLIAWNKMACSIDECTTTVKVALIGKYTGLQDSYLSVIKALRHASIACGVDLDIIWVEASLLESELENENTHTKEEHEEAWNKLKSAQGVIVPGGFGQRGWEGKLLAAQFCREHKVPYLGVCLGFQAMVVEYCRNVLKLEGADSTEINESTAHPVVIFMPEIDKETMGGTMRLGARTTLFTHNINDKSSSDGDSDTVSTTRILYGKDRISERHRHRYEINPEFVDKVHNSSEALDHNLKLVARDETGERMEIAELPRSQHPYYVGCQFHPEFLSRPLKPSPPFHGLLLAVTGQLNDYLDDKAGTKK